MRDDGSMDWSYSRKINRTGQLITPEMQGRRKSKEDTQVSGLPNCKEKDAITEGEREHSRKTRLFCFVSPGTG